jgi:hypothetical protein
MEPVTDRLLELSSDPPGSKKTLCPARTDMEESISSIESVEKPLRGMQMRTEIPDTAADMNRSSHNMRRKFRFDLIDSLLRRISLGGSERNCSIPGDIEQIESIKLQVPVVPSECPMMSVQQRVVSERSTGELWSQTYKGRISSSKWRSCRSSSLPGFSVDPLNSPSMSERVTEMHTSETKMYKADMGQRERGLMELLKDLRSRRRCNIVVPEQLHRVGSCKYSGQALRYSSQPLPTVGQR